MHIVLDLAEPGDRQAAAIVRPTSPTMVPTVILIPRIHGLPPIIIGLRVILSSSGNCMAQDLKPGNKKNQTCWEQRRKVSTRKPRKMISKLTEIAAALARGAKKLWKTMDILLVSEP